jgi:hypothetical protein
MNRLVERLGASWGALFRDVLLIVVGILIAFGLDAWWEGVREQRRVDESLAAVQVELRANLAQLDTVLSRNEASIASVREIFARSDTEAVPDLVKGCCSSRAPGPSTHF